ncbi:response regulator [Hymenobacter fastidiosus]
MKIYLIDDDDLGIYLTEQLLRVQRFSNSISTFQLARQALDTLVRDTAGDAPQGVFLDLNRPGMNGWQFLDALAPYEAELLGRCHIYILTSSLALSDLAKSREYELVAGPIHKPIDREEIRAIHARLKPDDAPA